ncbi:two pore domain potassium channel family protein [Candidatus Fermentibacteria bacterium]|nr:two pore domain potassium channel family protein [Candidatus Fermentibacteria bacterium]
MAAVLVDYGDLSPQTLLGRVLASVVMLAGSSVIPVPTDGLTVEMARAARSQSYSSPAWTCAACTASEHDVGARFCKRCGAPLIAGGEDTPRPEPDSG